MVRCGMALASATSASLTAKSPSGTVKSYPSVPYIVTLLMDQMERVTPDAPGHEYAGRKFVAQKLWAPTAAAAFLAAHLKSLADFPPSQGAGTFMQLFAWTR